MEGEDKRLRRGGREEIWEKKLTLFFFFEIKVRERERQIFSFFFKIWEEGVQ